MWNREKNINYPFENVYDWEMLLIIEFDDFFYIADEFCTLFLYLAIKNFHGISKISVIKKIYRNVHHQYNECGI